MPFLVVHTVYESLIDDPKDGVGFGGLELMSLHGQAKRELLIQRSGTWLRVCKAGSDIFWRGSCTARGGDGLEEEMSGRMKR